jgi:hypothetical protein
VQNIGVLEELVGDCTAFRAKVRAALRCTEREAKKKVLATGYMQGLGEDAPEELKAFRGVMARLFDAVAAARPEAYEAVKGWKDVARPNVTLGSYVLMHREREALDKLAAAAGHALMFYEADGVVVLDADTEAQEAIHRSTCRALHLERYPQNMAEWKAAACERYPNTDFAVRSRYKWQEVAAAFKSTADAIDDPEHRAGTPQGARPPPSSTNSLTPTPPHPAAQNRQIGARPWLTLDFCRFCQPGRFPLYIRQKRVTKSCHPSFRANVSQFWRVTLSQPSFLANV